MAETADVVVAGGGVIGSAIAWRAAAAGLDVVLVDPDLGDGASLVAAGMLAPVSESLFGEGALLRLNLLAVGRFGSFAAELEELTGHQVGLRREGTLAIAYDPGDQAALARLTAFRRSAGLAAKELDARACRELEPFLAPDVRAGVLFPGDWSVNNRRYAAALREAMQVVKVRIIQASVTVTCHDGTTYGGAYRFAATLLDHRAYPAQALIGLYHERWEHEITYLALRHTLLQGRVLRSGDPAGLEQEMWALRALYQALRTAITDAVQAVPGTDPDRASYQIAVETAQVLLTSARNITGTATDLAGDIGRAVLANLHGPRRPRVCARRVKSPLSRYAKHPPGKPRANLKITSLHAVISQYRDEKKTRRRRSLTQPAGP